jgi:uncharacterized protein (TIGR03437 family)
MITMPDGTVTVLTSENGAAAGKVVMHGGNVNVRYALMPNAVTPPAVFAGGVANGASFAAGAPVTPGGLATVFGNNLGSSPAGVTVLMGGVAAPFLAVSPGQINFQVPWQLGSLVQTGTPETSLTVTSGGVTSAPVTVALAEPAPGIFLLNASGQAAVLNTGTTSIAAPAGTFPGSLPAVRGGYISIYCTGLGYVTNQPATGAPALDSPLSYTSITPVSVSIGGVSAPVSFSGLAPGFVGLYQVNAQVPGNAPTGAAVPLTKGNALRGTPLRPRRGCAAGSLSRGGAQSGIDIRQKVLVIVSRMTKLSAGAQIRRVPAAGAKSPTRPPNHVRVTYDWLQFRV